MAWVRASFFRLWSLTQVSLREIQVLGILSKFERQ